MVEWAARQPVRLVVLGLATIALVVVFRPAYVVAEPGVAKNHRDGTSHARTTRSVKKQHTTINFAGIRPFIYEDTTPGPPPRVCGPMALRIVCEKLGVRADVEELARRAGTDVSGTTLYGLKRAAESTGLHAKGLQVNMAYLKKMPKPVVAWVGRDHYIVVVCVRRERLKIIDPNQGLGELDMDVDDFARLWDGYVLAVSRPARSRVAGKLRGGG